MYAFAEPVRTEFRSRYGREPGASWEDCTRIRRIRGDFYTEFLREGKRRAAAAGKRFAAHIEAGIEVPPECDQRMQFNLDWERWIAEGIVDELVLKWWFPQNPFIHERVLPLARRHGVPVYIVDRNSSLRRTPRALERAECLVREARAAGFAGYLWYEAADYKCPNAEGRPVFRAHSAEAIRRSAEVAQGA
jgi:hypothetical protein